LERGYGYPGDPGAMARLLLAITAAWVRRSAQATAVISDLSKKFDGQRTLEPSPFGF
jgi:hypothetical protein